MCYYCARDPQYSNYFTHWRIPPEWIHIGCRKAREHEAPGLRLDWRDGLKMLFAEHLTALSEAYEAREAMFVPKKKKTARKARKP